MQMPRTTSASVIKMATVWKNAAKAVEWYRKAADQGHEEAKKAIDRMQGGGLGSAVAAGAALAGVGLLWKILNS